jgi:hypothetical protein
LTLDKPIWYPPARVYFTNVQPPDGGVVLCWSGDSRVRTFISAIAIEVMSFVAGTSRDFIMELCDLHGASAASPGD